MPSLHPRPARRPRNQTERGPTRAALPRRIAHLVARSVDAPPEVLPVLAEWFAPLTALGCQPRRIVNWLANAGLPPKARVLELACGKGAAAVALAARLGCRVLGIDAFPPFIAAADAAARRRGVQQLCTFRCGMIEDWTGRRTPRFDATLMLNAWPLPQAAPLLRRLTRPGGVYLIDDAVRVGPDSAGQYADLDTADEVRTRIETLGDRIERSHVLTPGESRRIEAQLYDRLRRQAARMVRQRPGLRPLLSECLARQRAAIRDLCGPLRPGLWLVRRGHAR